jgi:cell division septum initiation protein DivIVA
MGEAHYVIPEIKEIKDEIEKLKARVKRLEEMLDSSSSRASYRG